MSTSIFCREACVCQLYSVWSATSFFIDMQTSKLAFLCPKQNYENFVEGYGGSQGWIMFVS